MTASLDDLVASWEKEPDERSTIELCAALGASVDPKLVDEIGKRASIKHASSPQVLMAIGRMYMRAGRLGDAQGLLVSAGKMNPRDSEVYRWLGEVLLLRGDATRASKVLERAVVLGRTDDETVFWQNQADAFMELQKRSGAQAVVAALSEILLKMGLPPPPRSRRPPPRSSAPAAPAPLPVPREEVSSDAEVTVIRDDPRIIRMEEPSAPDLTPAPLSSPPSPMPQPFAQLAEPAEDGGPISVPSPEPMSIPAVPPPKVWAPHLRPLPRTPAPPPNSDEEAPTRKKAGAVLPDIPPEPPLPSFEIGAPSRSPIAEAASIVAARPSMAPLPRDMLNALTQTGVFEPAGAGLSTWDAPAKKPRTRFTITLIVLTAIVVVAGVGVMSYVRDIRAKHAAEARRLDAEVASLLRSGEPGELSNAETRLARAFELDPLSSTTALLWVRNRVLRLLEAEGESQGIDTAVRRARQMSVPEAELAFARIASALSQGDTAGAVALVPQWDEHAKQDPYYQLLAGVALERAGDLRSLERFQLAVNLDPELAPAQVLLARAVLLEGDRSKGLELARSFRTKWAERPEGAALMGLAWARDPARGPLPSEADLSQVRPGALPLALRPIASAVEGLQAMEKNAPSQAQAAIERAISLANTPAIATWLGSLALQIGDDVLARRAALQALSFSAVYPPAHVLSARVALAGGHIDDAMNAMAELDASSPEVAVVRAAVAYERLDASALTLAVEALSPEVRASPQLSALVKAPDVLRGTSVLDPTRLRALAASEVAWGDMIALDAALDAGNLVVARELIDRFHDARDRPPRALRVARYLRYTDHAADADVPSKLALTLPTARSVLERVLVLRANQKADEARSLVAKNATLLGTMAPWASAYVDAEGPRAGDARARAALLEIPPPGAPLAWRMLAALTMVELGDKKRSIDLVRALAHVNPRNPDIVLAADAFRH